MEKSTKLRFLNPSLRTYPNGSAILGQVGDCRPKANCSSSVSMDSALYNLTSDLYQDDWYEGLYGLGNRDRAHCHTFNPKNVSAAGHQGQLYAYLGQPTSSLSTDYTRGFDIYLHERNQFWPGWDMESIGQTKTIGLDLKNEVRGTFFMTQMKKLPKPEEPCEEGEEYSLTECLMEFVASSAGCFLDWGQSYRSEKFPACRSLEEIEQTEEILLSLSKLSWNSLTQRTGCYGKCSFRKITYTEVRTRINKVINALVANRSVC